MLKILVIAIVSLGCGSTPQNQPKVPVQNTINEDFNSFIVKFSSDRAFQIGRISFPLPLYTENEQGKSIVKKILQKEWKYTDFIGIEKKNKKNEIEIEITSNSNAKLIYSMEDNGVYVIHHFIKKTGKWYLSKISDESE